MKCPYNCIQTVVPAEMYNDSFYKNGLYNELEKYEFLCSRNPYLINSAGNKKFVGWKPNNAFRSPGCSNTPSNLLSSLSAHKISP